MQRPHGNVLGDISDVAAEQEEEEMKETRRKKRKKCRQVSFKEGEKRGFDKEADSERTSSFISRLRKKGEDKNVVAEDVEKRDFLGKKPSGA